MASVSETPAALASGSSPQVLQLQGQVEAQEPMELLAPGLPGKLNPQHLIQVSAGKENKITARLAAAYGGPLSSTITQWQREAPSLGQSLGLQAL